MIKEHTLRTVLNKLGINRAQGSTKNLSTSGLWGWKTLVSQWIWKETPENGLYLYDPSSADLHIVSHQFELISSHIRKFNDPTRTNLVESWSHNAKEAAANSIYRAIRVWDMICGVMIGLIIALLISIL